MELLLVGIGGAFGSVARFQLGKILSERSKSSFPIATFLVNISGAFLLGVVCSLGLNSNMNLLLAEGFLGAFTTFSTFMYEGFKLFGDNKKFNAVTYIIVTLILGIVGYVLGFIIISLFSF
ncbi:MAG: fluoride efflux transporter CrcB [Vulcanibacillus sp.]